MNGLNRQAPPFSAQMLCQRRGVPVKDSLLGVNKNGPRRAMSVNGHPLFRIDAVAPQRGSVVGCTQYTTGSARYRGKQIEPGTRKGKASHGRVASFFDHPAPSADEPQKKACISPARRITFATLFVKPVKTSNLFRNDNLLKALPLPGSRGPVLRLEVKSHSPA